MTSHGDPRRFELRAVVSSRGGRWKLLEGAAVAAMDDGRIVELKAGMLFYVPGEPHDSWVIGNERYVSLHFLGAEGYATSRQ